ncbi:MAG: PilN family type IVB pilus formation outer membrane protein [Betaproteobacteria bacterium]|jgi:type IVB pilus formation R64 PilN family outer membrane protein|nr:PilN family type IVB pilus formation outer membrane protein [Betaproteobacteria bacterium]
MKRFTHRTIVSLTAAALLAGCAATRVADERIEQNAKLASDYIARAAASVQPQPPAVSSHSGSDNAPLVIKQESYRKTPAVEAPKVAPVLKETVLVTRQFSSLLEVTDWIRERYALPIRGSSDITELNVSADRLRFINFQGTVEHFLDALAMRTGVVWTFTDGAVFLSTNETRVYAIDASPGDIFLTTALSAQGTSSSGGAISAGSQPGNMTSNTQLSANISIWTGVERAVTGLLSKAGRMNLSQATGLLTVTDRADVHDKVKELVERTNARLNTQVIVNVRSFVVRLRGGDSYGIDWKAVYKNLANQYGLTVNSTFDALATGTNAVFSILPNSTLSGGRFNTSEAVFQAVSQQADTVNVSNSTISTVNGTPSPLHIGTQRTYLAAVSSSQTANVGSQVTLTPGVVNSGLVMNVTPVVLENKDIKLQFSLDLSNLLGITRVSSGGNSIETPSLDRRSSLQTVIVKNGEALVIAGSEQTADTNDRKGVGSPMNYLFGGGVNSSTTRESLVIIITARTSERKVGA